MSDANQEVPRVLAEAALRADNDPVLAGMLKRGLPLTRATYLAMAYGPDLPREWTAEHEMEVPQCFRNEHAVKHDPAKKPHHDGTDEAA